MITNMAKRSLREGRVTIGAWLALGSPIAAEIVGSLGFDWVVVDTEHGSIDIESVARIIKSVCPGSAVPMVRVAWNDPKLIKCALDAGAYGVVVPMVNSREDAIHAVAASRYPPLGIRSYGGPRARLYGGVDYFEHANEEIAVVLQIEHITAVNCIDQILSVEGVDAFFIGPSDLAASMGLKPGENTHPRLTEAVDHVIAAGRRHGVPGGILVGTPEAANQYVDKGLLFVGVGSDEGFLRSGAQATLNKVRRRAEAG